MTLFLMILLITNQGLTGGGEKSSRAFGFAVGAGGYLTPGHTGGFVSLRFNYFMNEKYFLSPELLSLTPDLAFRGIAVNVITNESSYIGAGVYFCKEYDLPRLFFKIQGGKVKKKIELFGFIMGAPPKTHLVYGIGIGLLLRNN